MLTQEDYPILTTPSILAVTLLFGTILFTYFCLCAKCYLAGDTRAIHYSNQTSSTHAKSSTLNYQDFTSILTFIHQWSIFGLVLLFAFICEYHPPFPHGPKSYDRDDFFFVILVLFLVGLYSIEKNEEKSSEILNRHQTEEWKGWMQVVFLLYHYYHAEEVYNSIRIMITCYVWLTGFGNFSYFYLKKDYSFIRVLQMMWRLNFLVIFLCLSQNTTYILYYICPLHTFFFFVVYFTMYWYQEMNYSKYGLRFKLALLAFGIFCVWDINSGLFQLFHWLFLSNEKQVGATYGSMWEWYFRSSLDHWSTFLGMIFAANHPITCTFIQKLEELPNKLLSSVSKGIVGLGLAIAFYLWMSGPFLQSKQLYNQTNAYFGFIPLLTYIYFRNYTPKLRDYSMTFFHNIGKTTLETYLMQHHIWLSSNAKTLLVLVPGWPKVNFIVVTFLYAVISKRLYKLTMYLRGMLLPNDDLHFCLRSLASLFGTIILFYSMAISMSILRMVNFTTIGITCLLCGFCLYQTILEYTWNHYRQTAPPLSTGPESFLDDFMKGQKHVKYAHQKERNESLVSKMTPPIIGCMMLTIVGLSSHAFMARGASKKLPLKSYCEPLVNEGKWIPFQTCHETQRGEAFREYDVNSVVCDTHTNPTALWAWKKTNSNTLCHFTHRSVKALTTTLKNRKILLVGDSSVRCLYYALLRSVGVTSSSDANHVDYYDATIPRHADLNHHYKKYNLLFEFKWAPLATDQAAMLRDVMENEKLITKPDLIIVGGGAWDRLHTHATESNNMAALENSLNELSKTMRQCRDSKKIPVTWVIPTTIYSEALTDETKRQYLKEEDINEMRLLHVQHNVLSSSSFVLDGPAITSQRVLDSYDGIHYPPQVYDAAIQILVNAFDWLLTPRNNDDEVFLLTPQSTKPQVGSMSNPTLGLMMLCFIFIALLFFDGFMGFSFLASIFVKGVMPNELYEVSFSALHKKFALPPVKKDRDSSNKSDVVDFPSYNVAAIEQQRKEKSTATNIVTDKKKDEDIVIEPVTESIDLQAITTKTSKQSKPKQSKSDAVSITNSFHSRLLEGFDD